MRRNVGDDVAERLQTLAFGDSDYLIEYELIPASLARIEC
jgi:hypothetical protein